MLKLNIHETNDFLFKPLIKMKFSLLKLIMQLVTEKAQMLLSQSLSRGGKRKISALSRFKHCPVDVSY